MTVEIPLKKKYRSATNGRFRGGHNMQGTNKRKKTGKPDVVVGTRTMVMLPSGKIRMEWR